MSVFVQTNRSFRETANVKNEDWFETKKKFRIKIIRNRGSLSLFVDGEPILESAVPESMWVPKLHIQASFGSFGEEFYIDNVVVRAPANVSHEIEATKLEEDYRDQLKLTPFVVAALESDSSLDEEVKKMAIRFAKLYPETAGTRKESLRKAVLDDQLAPSIYRSAIQFLKEDLKGQPDEWETRQILAALYFRCGEYKPALEALIKPT